MNLTFLERIILDTLCAQFLSHHEVIQKKGFVTRQRKHIVIATWTNLINIPSNKPVKSRTVCVYFVKKYFVEKYSKNRYCFQLWILGILSWTSSAEKTVRKISLLEIRVRIFKKSIWDLPSESYRFLGSDIVFSPKINFYPITLPRKIGSLSKFLESSIEWPGIERSRSISIFWKNINFI